MADLDIHEKLLKIGLVDAMSHVLSQRQEHMELVALVCHLISRIIRAAGGEERQRGGRDTEIKKKRGEQTERKRTM